MFLVSPVSSEEPRRPLPPFIHNSGIIVNPKNPKVVYAAFWLYGVYKSSDHGKTWRPINRGFKNTSVYTLAMSAQNPDVLFAGTHAGGMYKTTDGGETWREVNTGLTNGTIWDLALDPGPPEVLYALTSLGLFKTVDGGSRWDLLPGGVPGPLPDQQMTLFAIPSRSFSLFLQNGGRLFRWTGAWSGPLLTEITTIRARPFASDPKTGAIYAGTLKGLFRSTDGAATWAPLSTELVRPDWIVLDPGRSDTLYVGTDGKGMFKSSDGGKTFRPLNNGLTGPTSLKIFGLAVDPKEGRRLYAASHSIGLFRTEDGGEHWTPPEKFPIPEIAELAASTKAAVTASPPRPRSIPSPPSDFLVHCNRCHGWGDPILDNRSDVIWRAAPTPRDWTATVERMGTLAALNQPQKAAITAYLNTYFGP